MTVLVFEYLILNSINFNDLAFRYFFLSFTIE